MKEKKERNVPKKEKCVERSNERTRKDMRKKRKRTTSKKETWARNRKIAGEERKN